MFSVKRFFKIVQEGGTNFLFILGYSNYVIGTPPT